MACTKQDKGYSMTIEDKSLICFAPPARSYKKSFFQALLKNLREQDDRCLNLSPDYNDHGLTKLKQSLENAAHGFMIVMDSIATIRSAAKNISRGVVIEKQRRSYKKATAAYYAKRIKARRSACYFKTYASTHRLQAKIRKSTKRHSMQIKRARAFA